MTNNIGVWKESRFLPVILTAGELQSRGAQLADAVQKRDALEVEQKAAREEMKEAMVGAESRIGDLAKIVNERKETRAVEVECRLNVMLNLVEVIRTDTGEVIQTREAIPSDALRLQSVLPGLDEPQARPADRPASGTETEGPQPSA
jgi:uncharacterized FlaG/YvyC family protein